MNAYRIEIAESYTDSNSISVFSVEEAIWIRMRDRQRCGLIGIPLYSIG